MRAHLTRWRACLVVAAGALTADAVACGRAWLPGGERWLALAALALAALVAAALVYGWLSLTLAATAHLGRRARALALAAPLWMSLGWLAGETARARRLFGDGARVLGLAAALLATLALAALLARTWRRRWASAALALAALAALTLARARVTAPLPQLLASLWCVGALVATWPARAERPRWWRVGLGLPALLVLGAVAWPANLRWALATQPRALAPLLGVVRGTARAAHAASLPAAGASPLDAVQGALGDANLVVVTVDALRADTRLELAPFAPAVDLGAVYASVPRTAHSLTSLLTGAAPCDLARQPPTLATLLDRQHWATRALYPAGLFWDGREALAGYAAARFGFEWTDTRTLDAEPLTDAALASVATLRRDGATRRFFLWVHYFDPHEPYVAHAPARDDDAPRARYQSEVDAVARAVRRLLAGLTPRAGERPTLVVLAADHGEEFGEHGGAYHGTTLHDEQARVRVQLLALGAHLAPLRSDDAVALADVLPRALDLLGVEARPPHLASRPGARDVFAESDDARMLRRGRYKLIHQLTHDVDALYDLAADPGERVNLAGARPQETSALAEALRAHFALPAVPALMATLGDAQAPLAARLDAARALGEREATAARAALAALLPPADAPPALQREVAVALALLEDDRARPVLRPLLDAATGKSVDDAAWRQRAALALGHLRDPVAAPALIELLRHIRVDWRRRAAHYLGHVGDDAAAQALLAATADDAKIRNEAYEAAARITTRLRAPAAAPILALLAAAAPAETLLDARQRLEAALADAARDRAHALLPARALY